jgi:hypothetical protein
MTESGRPIGLGVAAVTLALVVLVAVSWRLLARRPSRQPGRSNGSVPAAPGQPATEPSDRERLIACAEEVRSALVARFGEGWRAKTTEEVAASAGLAEALGSETAGELIAFFRTADLAKFAGDRFDAQAVPGDDQRAPTGWAERSSELVSRIAAAGTAGAKSTINGK